MEMDSININLYGVAFFIGFIFSYFIFLQAIKYRIKNQEESITALTLNIIFVLIFSKVFNFIIYPADCITITSGMSSHGGVIGFSVSSLINLSFLNRKERFFISFSCVPFFWLVMSAFIRLGNYLINEIEACIFGSIINLALLEGCIFAGFSIYIFNMFRNLKVSNKFIQYRIAYLYLLFAIFRIVFDPFKLYNIYYLKNISLILNYLYAFSMLCIFLFIHKMKK